MLLSCSTGTTNTTVTQKKSKIVYTHYFGKYFETIEGTATTFPALLEAEDGVFERAYVYKDGAIQLVDKDFECEVLVIPSIKDIYIIDDGEESELYDSNKKELMHRSSNNLASLKSKSYKK